MVVPIFAGSTAPHPYGLFIDGLDVLKEPVNGRYGVSTDSIRVSEAGNAGVSTIRFVIDDPQNLITIANGAKIVYWDLNRNLPIFVGFLESLTLSPDFGQQGRSIEVQGYGHEALLDLIVVPSLVLNNGGPFLHGSDTPGITFWTQALLQTLVGFTPLRSGTDQRASPGALPMAASSLSGPIGGLTDDTIAATGTDVIQDTITVDLTGMTIRQALEAWRAVALQSDLDPSFQPHPYYLGVDLWGGVRFFEFGGGVTTYLPTDYASMTISDTPTGTLAAENISWEQDFSPQAIVNSVYVKGAAAASTGWVVGDTTTGRREGYATTTGTTGASMQAAAAAVMGSRKSAAGRGSFSLTSYTPTNVHPGSQVTITDARIGFSSKACLVTAIDKTFNEDGTQNWTVSFMDGGGSPSGGRASSMATLRTLTRATA